jgi:hypothetical protein
MKYFSIILLALAIALASCSKDSTNPTDNNNNNNNLGTNSAVVKSDKGDLTFKLGAGVFDVLYGYTDLAFSSFTSSDNQSTSGYAMSITFKGKANGDYILNDDNEIIIMKNYVVYGSVPGTGKITITKYGAVGQTIEGTFTAQFVSATGSETFTVASASFKAIRIEDEEDEDPDEDKSYSYMEIVMTTVAGASITFSDDKLLGNSSYMNQGGLLAIGVADFDEEKEYFRFGISIYAENIENKSNQTLVFEGESDVALIFTYEGMPYKFIGTAVINNFAQNVGDKFEVTGSGELYNLVDGEKAGVIQNFKIKVIRYS